MISKKELNTMADMAKFGIYEDEMDYFIEEANGILDFVGKIKNIDTSNVEMTEQLDTPDYSLREDLVETSLSREDAIKNTLEEQYGYFKILNVMD